MELNEKNLGITDSINLTSIRAKKKALMLRVGGLGDCLILTPVAKQLHKKGYSVDYFVGSPTGEVFELISGLPYFNSVKEISRVGNSIDAVKDEDGHYVSVEILKKNYDEVFDFKFSVEANRAGINKTEGWRDTLNSNYMNWVDLSLAWANFDWTKISDEDKRPELTYNSVVYDEWAEKLVPDNVIGIQLQASTLIRTWYKSGDLPDRIYKEFPDHSVLIFTNGWQLMNKYGTVSIHIPDKLNPLICSAALLKRCSIFISADSGFSHVAEALNIPTIGIYTTVPAWTRTKYYKYAHSLNTDVECHPCFELNMFCPIERKNALDKLTDREKDIIKSSEENISIFDVARKYSTAPRAIEMELQSARQRLDALSAVEPACVKSITIDMIINKVHEIIPTLRKL